MDALVEPLVAPAEECHVVLGGELRCERVVELAPGRRQHDRAGRRVTSRVSRLERGIHNVDPQNHPRSAAIGRIIYLAAGERRRLAPVEGAELCSGLEHVRHVPLAPKPLEPLGKEGEDVNAHAVDVTARR